MTNTEAKFTKGKWVACTNDQACWIDNVNNGLIADLEMTDIEDPDELYANAQLIAAAPEMYELLEFIASAPLAAPHKAVEIKKLLAKARGE